MSKRQLSGALILALCFAWSIPSAASDLFVYPTKGQTAAQQDRDEYQCYKWAKDKSGVDPTQTGQSGPNRRAAGTVGGAARGAGLGAAMGAIGGDAGKGAAMGAVGGAVLGRRRGRMTEQMESEMTRSTYHRAFAACMEGRGYTVK
jgi:outer membrane protein with glycine zipper